MSVPERAALIDVAMGYAPADTVVVNGRLVDVNTGTVREEGVAIKNGRIAAVGDVEYTRGPDTHTLDAGGRFLVLPHPEVAGMYAGRAGDPDRWLRGMNKLQRRIEAAS